MSADNFIVEKGGDCLGISLFEGLSFCPLGEMVYGDHYVSFSVGCSGKGSHDINANLVEGFWFLLDGGKRVIPSSSCSFLTDFASSDIFDYVILHVWPGVLSICSLIGVFLSKVSS